MDKNISPTLKCQEIIKDRENKGLKIYNYGLGANPIPQPELFINSLKEYSHKKDYTSSEGIPELNKTIKDIYKRENIDYDVLVGNGLKELLFIMQLGFEGKIFHINPSWVSYKEHINILKKNNNLIEINTNIDNKYRIDLNLLESELEKNKNESKIIIFNNPNNPLGISFENEEIFKISNILKRYNCIVISDEIYLNLAYKNTNSIAEYIPELTIRCSSVSKDMGCGGYRIGWAAFPSNQRFFFEKCKMISSSIYSCAPTPLQYATNVMLNNKKVFFKHCRMSIQIYKFLSDKICKILNETKLEFLNPNSCWYIFLNFRNYEEKLRLKNINNSEDLNLYLINTFGFVSVPGSAFNVKGLNIRISLVDFDIKINDYNIQSLNIKRMIEGINVLKNFLNNL